MWGPVVKEVLQLISEGVQTNLWGLRCPIHCSGTRFASLLAAFLFGVVAASGFWLWALFLWTYPPSPFRGSFPPGPENLTLLLPEPPGSPCMGTPASEEDDTVTSLSLELEGLRRALPASF